jgi:methionine synthase II (cobalamin-independent)
MELKMAANINDFKKLRVDQVGALRAPLSLRQMFERYDKDEVSKDAFVAVCEAAIEGMIHKQESLTRHPGSNRWRVKTPKFSR